MVIATWLDPHCKLTQSLESDTGEGLELPLHVWHVFEWLLFLDGPPLLLAWPQKVEELSLQLSPILLLAGGEIVSVEGPEDVGQVLLPSRTPIVSEVLQRVSMGGLLSTARLWQGPSRGGG